MLARLIPHPMLSVTLTLVWLALVNTVTLGNLLLGSALGIVIPMITAPYWPNRPTLRKPLAVAEFVLVVFWDIIVANIQVAAIILFRRRADIHSQWVTVPLDLTSPEAITALGGTITMTPGTVAVTLSADAGSMLVHCLHTDDPDGLRDSIKTRYERRLKEIFE
ncbi:Na+/H+ antiporter subunit E [Rhodobacter veldkampii DSM 11550]|uniref:Na+/H+ antiporter subunit E n=1 Tax=Phaeovulum veldkampii DSM 11550 TaxID=1185920 RepID=A0A2T4JMJ4_9RHOB|nr:Na+/H+ antiporter subunit E [Phaeovulum veldkampii]MBK5946669.1 Na+/H+ antiporter subunit E [Phaeovulum veldkampii DSM 11550]NCU19877.1 Na+/H+ antiporter subunit E [Candidatus Falkowbacteria bacterium]PTE19124.1 Na+/H+ antiporter subunit E [Phaeovulum veldkampii DSM 11550]TDQ61316.1 multisubunit potassium/proton antiporter PhaE subunit [Phaeovulum veldkampii DSM 11550]